MGQQSVFKSGSFETAENITTHGFGLRAMAALPSRFTAHRRVPVYGALTKVYSGVPTVQCCDRSSRRYVSSVPY